MTLPLSLRRNCKLDLMFPLADLNFPPTTMDSGDNDSISAGTPQRITMFYDGRVCVCDVTELQARTIIWLARKEMDERMNTPRSQLEPISPLQSQLRNPPEQLDFRDELSQQIEKICRGEEKKDARFAVGVAKVLHNIFVLGHSGIAAVWIAGIFFQEAIKSKLKNKNPVAEAQTEIRAGASLKLAKKYGALMTLKLGTMTTVVASSDVRVDAGEEGEGGRDVNAEDGVDVLFTF
ncbi:hypothetical protein NE237_031796 [Protea cynaroides]|uniref:Tify domain-containing protein n=1 Tax=Protea cynaroides TaxID=273540 RepID=A0A9Q0L255_9MAGN|nr:hypothetical protein NE237_031796 [Protea cynaroides]